MGFLEKLKKKKVEDAEEIIEEVKDVAKNELDETEEIEATGWDAITAEFERIYSGQTDPKHYGTLIKWIFGGNDPIDGISIYDGGEYWHFVTYGLTELYKKESEDLEYSGYGYEMTFKLKKEAYEDEEGEIRCICGILQAIARITFTKGELFGPFEFLYTGQTAGIDAYQKSNITGFICVPDSKLNTLETPNGKVEFLEFIGMTDQELKTLSTIQSVKDIFEKLGSEITDYNRKSIV